MTLNNSVAVGLALVSCAPISAHAQTFNGSAIAIPDIGPANPYPSTINVSGVVGPITTMSVTISDFAHTFGDDVGMLLVGPNGNALILADGPGDGAVGPVTWIFIDGATGMLPNAGPLVSGNFRPGQNQYDDVFTSPAPAPSTWYSSFADAFAGSSANGAWNLYVEDFVGEDGGSIGSWSITFGVPAPGALVTIAAGGAFMGPRRRRTH